MIDALFNQPDYVAAKKMLDATVLRQEAIASNLSNLETPNYKRLDVAPSFEAQLSWAVSSGDATQIAGLQPSLAVDGSAVWVEIAASVSAASGTYSWSVPTSPGSETYYAFSIWLNDGDEWWAQASPYWLYVM